MSQGGWSGFTGLGGRAWPFRQGAPAGGGPGADRQETTARMPWSNQSGGGGPWGRPGGNGGGPWGNGGKTPPNLEDLLRRGQDRLRGLIPGGGGSGYGGGGSSGVGGGRGAAVIAALAVAVWLATGFYTVYPRQVGIETIFGRYVGTKGEGLRYNFPYPIGG